jgi:hypothetical protein
LKFGEEAAAGCPCPLGSGFSASIINYQSQQPNTQTQLRGRGRRGRVLRLWGTQCTPRSNRVRRGRRHCVECLLARRSGAEEAKSSEVGQVCGEWLGVCRLVQARRRSSAGAGAGAGVARSAGSRSGLSLGLVRGSRRVHTNDRSDTDARRGGAGASASAAAQWFGGAVQSWGPRGRRPVAACVGGGCLPRHSCVGDECSVLAGERRTGVREEAPCLLGVASTRRVGLGRGPTQVRAGLVCGRRSPCEAAASWGASECAPRPFSRAQHPRQAPCECAAGSVSGRRAGGAGAGERPGQFPGR